MLERASLCLESGGRHLLRGPKTRLRSRRMLHSSFWHHAALDLDLSACWPFLLQPIPHFDPADHEHSTKTGRNAVAHIPYQDPVFLDFLYPAKTLAMMHRLSSLGWEAWHARQLRFRNNGRARQFSSRTSGFDNEHTAAAASSAGVAHDKPHPVVPEDAPDVNHFEDISPIPLGDLSEFDLEHLSEGDEIDLTGVENISETLRSLLDSGESDSKLVWSLWKKTAPAHRTPDLSAAVLDYLCSVKPFPRLFAEEVTAIFDNLDVKDRRPSSYRGAVRAYLLQDKLGKAALVHEHGVESGHTARGNIGTSDLLAYAIRKEKWQLAIEVYAEIASLWGPIQEAWSVADKSLEVHDHVELLLLYLRRMRRLTGRDAEEQDQIRTFATEFGVQAIGQCAPRSSSSTEERRLYRLILRLKQCAFLESRHYERAVQGLLSSSTKIQYARTLPLVVRKLYEMYIANAKTDKSVVPSENFFRSILFAMTRFMTKSHGTRLRGPRLTIGRVTADANTFHRRLSNQTLEVLMDGFARLGDVKRTKVWFRQIPVPQRKPFHLEFILEAYARRGDTDEAKKQFETIKQMMGRDPHVRAWNMLLHGHTRNDDLAGASQVFDELMLSSVKPDAYSFAAILDLLSQRGDVDGVKDMLALAADIDESIIRSTAVAGYLVTAFVNNDDMETAELVAKQLQKRKESRQMEGSLTPVWNNIATAYALRRDVASTRRVYEQMLADGVKPDEFTYAALLQALCLVRNPDAAWKLLRIVIPQKPVKQLALHYAIVMAGYINAGKYEVVPFVDRHRKLQGIRPSLSTRIATVKAAALSEHVGRYQARENEELVRTEKLLAHLLSGDHPWEYTAEPQTGLAFRTLDQADGAYLDIVMEIYGERGAFEMVERLLREFVARHKDMDPSDPARPLPLRTLLALMTVHFRARNHDEVERLWNLALEQATHLSQLAMPKMAIDPEMKYQPQSPINPARRHLLSRPLTVYLRSLHLQGRYTDAQRTVSGLLTQGFTLDNISWNLYVQLLARTGRILLAFGLCEKYLMPQWVGWRKKKGNLRKRYKRSRGWDYMNVNPNLTKPNVIMPQYRTMVILAAAMKYVRRLEAVGGVRMDTSGEAPLTAALLSMRSPRTVNALNAMPHIDDDLQTRFLGDD